MNVIIEAVAANLFEVFQLSQGHYPGAFSGKPNTGQTWSQLAADPTPDAVRLAGSWRAVACSVAGLLVKSPVPLITLRANTFERGIS